MERLVLRRVVLLGAPLALAILEIFHPERPNSASEAVEQGVWFMWFHFIQVPLIGFMALAVYLLTDRLEGRAASVSRWAMEARGKKESSTVLAAGFESGERVTGALCHAEKILEDVLRDAPTISAKRAA